MCTNGPVWTTCLSENKVRHCRMQWLSHSCSWKLMEIWEKARKQIGHRSSEKEEGKKKKEKKIIRITGNYNSLNRILIHCNIMKWSLKLFIYLGHNGIISSKWRRLRPARVVCVTNPPEEDNRLKTQNTGWTHSNNTTWNSDFFNFFFFHRRKHSGNL